MFSHYCCCFECLLKYSGVNSLCRVVEIWFSSFKLMDYDQHLVLGDGRRSKLESLEDTVELLGMYSFAMFSKCDSPFSSTRIFVRLAFLPHDWVQKSSREVFQENNLTHAATILVAMQFLESIFVSLVVSKAARYKLPLASIAWLSLYILIHTSRTTFVKKNDVVVCSTGSPSCFQVVRQNELKWPRAGRIWVCQYTAKICFHFTRSA